MRPELRSLRYCCTAEACIYLLGLCYRVAVRLPCFSRRYLGSLNIFAPVLSSEVSYVFIPRERLRIDRS